MNDIGRYPDRMRPEVMLPASTFDKVLQAFGSGDLPYTEVQFYLKRLLKTGTSPEELLDILRRRESINSLPEYAHVELLGLLDEAIEQEAAQKADLVAAQVENEDSVSDAAHAIDLTTEPAVAGTAPESEQSKTLENDKALAEGIASDDAALSPSAEAWRESDRHRAELRTLRDSLAARDATIAQVRRSLSERDTQLAMLQREHVQTVAALEVRAKIGTQLESELQTERARAADLAAELRVARIALESQEIKTQEIEGTLVETIALNEAALARSEESLRESERYQAEMRTLSESLAARDATIAQVRLSLRERDAQLTALQQQHAKIVPALEARLKTMEAELRAARMRVDALTVELKASQDAAAALNAQRKRDESQLVAARTELGAVQTRSSSYFEVLRTREWRSGFELNRFRELDARDDVPHAGHSAPQTERDSTRPLAASPQPTPQSMRAQDLQPPLQSKRVPAANLQPPLQSRRAAQIEEVSPFGPRRWNPGALTRAIGISAVVFVLAAIAWFFVHHVPAPATAPVPVSAAVPKLGTVIRDCPTCPAMTVLPAGRFKQGSARPESSAAPFEKPLHRVIIARPFAMSTSAVTVKEFSGFIAATGRAMQGCDTYDGEWRQRPDNSWENPGFVQAGSNPVTCVSWNDAQAYAKWLSTQTGQRYRLPSASEWEYAARAGSEAVQPWNPDGSGACASANVADENAAGRYPGWTVFPCDDGYVYTAPVGSFKANAFRLNDMLGNVFQWTEDCWHADYTGAPTDGSARTDGDCSEHELRGGSWFSSPAFVRANYRNHFGANYRTSSVGIRLVRDIAP
jgi:sulfatase modifying factor 1